jgi:hypothetical protein
MMRSFDYARTAPEAQEGFPVFVVVFADVIIGAGPYGQERSFVNGFWHRFWLNDVASDARVTR